MNFLKPYYDILGVNSKATAIEIKAAYRLMAMHHHPDRNPGDEEAAGRFRDVQEAYEILSDNNLRTTYDSYHEAALNIFREQSDSNETVAVEPKAAFVKTYTRKRFVKTERKIFVKGTIIVKYWGEPEIEQGGDLKSMHYRIHPTQVQALIKTSDIFPFQLNDEDTSVFSQADLFVTPVMQPICCTIDTTEGKEVYTLRLQELKIIAPVLKDITKYEEQSLGTLEAVFYAFVAYNSEEEIDETVYESCGPTGKEEEKMVNDMVYIRKEYYHADGKTYWSGWMPKQPISYSTSNGKNKRANPNYTFWQPEPVNHNDTGCFYVPLAILSILAVIFFPRVFFLLVILATVITIGVLINSMSRRSTWLLCSFIVAVILSAYYKSNNITTMRSFFDMQLLIPIGFILLWILIAVYAGGWILRKAGIARVPLAGIEYSEAIVSGSFIFGMLLLSTAAVGPVFNYYSIIAHSGFFPIHSFMQMLIQYSFILAIFCILFVSLSLFAAKYLPGVKQPVKEVKSGNIPLALILGMVAIGMAIVLRIVASAVMQEMVR